MGRLNNRFNGNIDATLMDLKSKVRKRFSDSKRRIVLPEFQDKRVLRAAAYLVEEHLCEVSLVGDPEKIENLLKRHGIDMPDSIEILNYGNFGDKQSLVDFYWSQQKHKGISKEEAKETLFDPLFFAASLVATDYADGCVAGSVATTGDVIRAAIKCIGLSERSSIVSSVFLMLLPDGKVLTYGDCGVVPYPDKEQLASIAIDSALTHKMLTDEKPYIGMLSFSTKGSAVHERVKLVREALEIVRAKKPGLMIDGEFQFDAAFVPEIAKRKAPNSSVAGKVNVFVFPNLDAGNIAYKITERLGGAQATGPILQGLKKPMMDLSRGCKWQDIVNAACVALLMVKN